MQLFFGSCILFIQLFFSYYFKLVLSLIFGPTKAMYRNHVYKPCITSMVSILISKNNCIKYLLYLPIPRSIIIMSLSDTKVYNCVSHSPIIFCRNTLKAHKEASPARHPFRSLLFNQSHRPFVVSFIIGPFFPPHEVQLRITAALAVHSLNR